jgi:hypothetical protein
MAFILYGTTIGWDFVFDDPLLINENEKIRTIKSIIDFFSSGVWHNTALNRYADTMDSYRPLHMAYLILNYKLWAGKAFGFHLVNIVLQAINSILVYFIAKHLTGDRNIIYPFFGALLFAVHPIHIESVSWISASADLLTTFFLLLSFFTYTYFARDRNITYTALSVVLFAFALLTKEVAIVFPVIICTYDVLVRKKARVYRWLSFVTIAILFLAVRKNVLSSSGWYGMEINQDGLRRLFEFACGYLQLAVWPWPITIYQGTPLFGVGVIIFSVLILAAMLLVALHDRRCIICLVWFAAFIAPPLALCFTPQFDTKYYFADRYLYLPSVGIALLFSLLLPRYFETRRKIMVITFVPVFLVMGAVTVLKTFDWQNDATLFSVFMRKYPERVSNYVTVGLFYEKNRNFAKANDIYKEALGYMRNDKDRATIFDGLGRTYGMSGQVNNAITAFEMALTLNPKMSSALVGLGNMTQDYNQASYYYNKALEVNNTDIMACNNLVSLNKIHGYWDKAAYYQSKCQTLRQETNIQFH